MNVLAIDYRGFGNSEGSPTEDGLALDARAAWDYLMAHKGDRIYIFILALFNCPKRVVHY